MKICVFSFALSETTLYFLAYYIFLDVTTWVVAICARWLYYEAFGMMMPPQPCICIHCGLACKGTDVTVVPRSRCALFNVNGWRATAMARTLTFFTFFIYPFIYFFLFHLKYTNDEYMGAAAMAAGAHTVYIHQFNLIYKFNRCLVQLPRYLACDITILTASCDLQHYIERCKKQNIMPYYFVLILDNLKNKKN